MEWKGQRKRDVCVVVCECSGVLMGDCVVGPLSKWRKTWPVQDDMSGWVWSGDRGGESIWEALYCKGDRRGGYCSGYECSGSAEVKLKGGLW